MRKRQPYYIPDNQSSYSFTSEDGKNLLNKMAQKVTMKLAKTVMVMLHRIYGKQHFTYLRENSNKVYGEALPFNLFHCLEM